MRKFTLFFVFLLFVGMQAALAQMEVKGTVTDAKDGTPLPGVSIVVKGTLTGTVTDVNGKYKLTVPAGYDELIFSFVGMLTKEEKINGRANVDVSLAEDVVGLNEVVVTALGVSREKKSLGYATQEVSGADVNAVKGDNFINNLQGKVSGVQIQGSGNIGGSTNVIIRGSSSLTQNNQALFVVDGVPINNDNVNNAGQISGRNGYDYGNAASDINPNDIASINVLKGAAATALYGQRAANGVVIITTKKGVRTMTKTKSYGVTISSNVTTGFVDKSTFPKYQHNYGAGYGAEYYSDTTLSNGQNYPGFEYLYDVNGDGTLDWTVPTYEDASMGQKFDPNILVYQWDSYYPASPNYQKATPWVNHGNAESFFQNSLSLTNSVEVAGGAEGTAYRLSYTNQYAKGIMPNSEIMKNSFMLSGSHDIISNLTVSASANYINTAGKGRNSTGYSDNILSSFRQWMQTNVDYQEQKALYDKTGENISWNPNSPFDLTTPAYWDNPYFLRYKNYETDERDRLIGYAQLDYKITGYLSFMGRASIDTYNELQEERKAIGSTSGEFGVNRPDVISGYSRFMRKYTETNWDFLLKFNKSLSESFSLNALIGTNIRRDLVDQVYESTDGGLIVPGQYSLGNSVNQMQAPQELLTEIGVNGMFAQASLGFKDMLYLDATIRRDQSSTLPKDNNVYWYPSVSGSWLFSQLLDVTWLQLGKLRLGWAQVGNDAPWGSIKDTYTYNGNFSGTSMFSLPSNKANDKLKPEISSSVEAGLEMTFFQKRLGFDLAFYQNNTVNQIMPVAVSYATGYSGKYVNAGEVQNKGVELQLFGTPVQSGDFRWDIMLNWAKNKSKVVRLDSGLTNLQLNVGGLQGGVSINARVGEPYGTIQGTDYVYQDGQRVVKSNGYYLKSSTSDIVIGNIQPDFTAGLNNKFTYKSWALSFLIDWQQGGDIFSLDLYYGMATGIYEETDFINDLGNPVRNSLAEGGGLINPGVVNTGTADNPVWEQNTKRVNGNNYNAFGYSQHPNSEFIYDASYVKLREVVLTYSLPAKVVANTALKGVSFSLVGSNLWIIMKNLPHADPEASQSSGNIQGWQSGVMPTTRNVGFTVNLQF
jgi:TonB-linked SusC/RagA family outer membrane protein